jgi:anti-sigma factor (TIGR02949 family)
MAGKDCDDLLHELADFLHGGELTPDRQAQMEAHLHECPPCLETADFQDQLRKLVAKRCCEEVPEELKSRIASLLADPAAFGGPAASL